MVQVNVHYQVLLSVFVTSCVICYFWLLSEKKHSSSCVLSSFTLPQFFFFFLSPTSCDYLHVSHLCWVGGVVCSPLVRTLSEVIRPSVRAALGEQTGDMTQERAVLFTQVWTGTVQCVNLYTGVCMRLVSVFGSTQQFPKSDLNFSHGRKQSLCFITSVWILNWWH